MSDVVNARCKQSARPSRQPVEKQGERSRTTVAGTIDRGLCALFVADRRLEYGLTTAFGRQTASRQMDGDLSRWSLGLSAAAIHGGLLNAGAQAVGWSMVRPFVAGNSIMKLPASVGFAALSGAVSSTAFMTLIFAGAYHGQLQNLDECYFTGRQVGWMGLVYGVPFSTVWLALICQPKTGSVPESVYGVNLASQFLGSAVLLAALCTIGISGGFDRGEMLARQLDSALEEA